ncbi:AAA family ATPase [Streptomyces sp. NPDC093516]|uniref:ATP-binding protein n=1 Tax=Streptomyces sp. NPDC093516 TaxID=3155304 RepID=UPI003445BA7A
MNDLDGSGRPAPARLIGRDGDLAFVRSHLACCPAHGATLLLTGEAGIGKSALLDLLADEARREGVCVLRAGGVQFEADTSYTGLNQLLVPLFDTFDQLDPSHRDALRVAVGIGTGPPPSRLLVSTAALLLLRRTAQRTPVLLVVDDLPWLDRATTAVLGFLTRRLAGSRVTLLAAARLPFDCAEVGSFTAHRLAPLDDASACALLARTHPGMTHALRRRIATEARGNPLALRELPAALEREQHTPPPTVLPLGERLQALYSSRVAELPPTSRELLLLTALEGTGDLSVLQGALKTTALGGTDVVETLEPAERDRLVTFSHPARRVTFEHPLIGSAVVALATTADRRKAHRMLAAALVDQPERHAWHLGAAAAGPDETVADLLEQAARTRLARGDALGAVAALTRAADLSPTGAGRSRRLAKAAYIGSDAGGELSDAARLLAGARHADPGSRRSLHAAAASALLLINKEGGIDTAHRVLVCAVESGDHHYDATDEALVDTLFTLIMICWYSGDPEKWAPLFRALDRLTPAPPDPLWVCAQTFADPARTGDRALGLLDTLLDGIDGADADPTLVVRLGTCSYYPDRLASSRQASERLVEQGRAGTAPVRRYLAALLHLCLDHHQTGRWDEALRLADEGLDLCERHGYPFFSCKLQFVKALVAGARGDTATTAALAEEIVRWAAPRGAHGAQALALHVRALGALSDGNFESAYRHTCALSRPGTLPAFLPQAMAAAMDLVEAAVRTGRTAEAAAHAAALRDSAMPRLSPRLHLTVLACEALTTPTDAALVLFDRALSLVGPDDWPFETARVRLYYGERLRRRRATREAREQLALACDEFTRLRAAPWVRRAEAELRVATRATATLPGRSGGPLTAQEWEIATLAATGLTNRQIAERLLLSHRTIGTHLYQIYPKLGIGSRAALRDALAALALEGAGRQP